MKAVWEWFSSRWGTISGTVIVVSGIWGFFLNQTINLKSEQINIIREQLNSAREQSSSTREQKSVVEEQNKFLEMQIKYLSEHGPFPQTAQKIEDSIKEIQKKLIPLATLYRFDPLAATVNLGVEGGMQAVFSTDISIKIRRLQITLVITNITLLQNCLMR